MAVASMDSVLITNVDKYTLQYVIVKAIQDDKLRLIIQSRSVSRPEQSKEDEKCWKVSSIVDVYFGLTIFADRGPQMLLEFLK